MENQRKNRGYLLIAYNTFIINAMQYVSEIENFPNPQCFAICHQYLKALMWQKNMICVSFFPMSKIIISAKTITAKNH